ncbi:hypothetical protein H3Z83_05155 [Tenacibaculum sp. S7007]|uniref:DUF5018 domain-containing protein n=1 Tax=Tenacibaculum pelagium TaxID=2759527 RepID=A0A839ANE5_9FLAO|nr:hypothetical protein [Tenacibaculum pelagium]MBA6155908.1 hypothetical protein [Tenacibaculum pelagium]
MKNTLLILSMAFALIFTSCSEEDIKSNENSILNFSIIISGDTFNATINNTSITTTLPALTNVKNLKPVVEISEKATVTPSSGQVIDFSSPVEYKVKAENGDVKVYTVNINVTPPLTDNSIKSFSFLDLPNGVDGSYDLINKSPNDIDTLLFKMPYKTDVTSLKSKIEINETASVIPKSGEILDYTAPVVYKVTAQDSSVKEYVVIIDKFIDQLNIKESVFYASLKDKMPGELMSLKVNRIHPVLDSVKVNLISNESIALEVDRTETIDKDNHNIFFYLPNDYKNNKYKFEVSIEHDNKDETTTFFLAKGEPNFLFVNGSSGSSHTINTLLVPYYGFRAEVIVDVENKNDYNFYLRKNDKDYMLGAYGFWDNSPVVHFQTSVDHKLREAESGSDFKFIIKYNDKEFEFPFINDLMKPIGVTVTQEAKVVSVSKSEVYKNEEFDILGENLFYNRNINGQEDKTPSKLVLKAFSRFKYISFLGDLENKNQATVSIPAYIKSGAYGLDVLNNVSISSGGELATKHTIVVKLGESEHPNVKIDGKSKLYNNQGGALYRQLLIKFDAKISDRNVEKIVFVEKDGELEINNFVINDFSVLTNQLSDEDFNRVLNHDGYVLVDGHKIHFAVELQ